MAGESQETPGSMADPSVMTTEALLRGLGGERDYVNGQLDVIRARLNGMDEATRVLHETVTRTPTEIQQAVGHLKELHGEKFESIATQFRERDTRSERESRDNKVAVDAAFAAQKEAAAEQNKSNTLAINKSEESTAATIKEARGQIDDLKERIGRIESNRQGANEARTDQRLNTGTVVAIVTVVVGALGLLITTVVVLANVLTGA